MLLHYIGPGQAAEPKTLEVKVNQFNPSGIGFTRVEITAEDVVTPGFDEYMQCVIYPRLALTGPGTGKPSRSDDIDL
jgi:hypothetical protein